MINWLPTTVVMVFLKLFFIMDMTRGYNLVFREVSEWVKGDVVDTYNESVAHKEAMNEAEEDGLEPPDSLQRAHATCYTGHTVTHTSVTPDSLQRAHATRHTRHTQSHTSVTPDSLQRAHTTRYTRHTQSHTSATVLYAAQRCTRHARITDTWKMFSKDRKSSHGVINTSTHTDSETHAGQ